MPAPDAQPPVDPQPPVEVRVARIEARQEAADKAGRRLIRNAVLLVVAVTLVAALGVWRVETVAHTAQTGAATAQATASGLAREEVARQVAQCTSANEFRRLFRGYLDTQGARTGGGSTSLLDLPGFDDLDGPTQEYVRGLVALLAAGAADARKVRAQYVERFPIADCAKVRRKAEAKLGG